MRHLFFWLVLFYPLMGIYAQKQGNIWMFGQGGALDFNSGIPVPFTGSQIYGTPTQSGQYMYSEGSSSISDSSGRLVFYSNGQTAWNSSNQVMLNGDSIAGYYSSTSSAFIVPVPLNDSLYYLFTTDGLERLLQGGLRYSIVDRCLDDGNGGVVASQKNILLLDTASEKLCAIAHPNGTDVWLIAHKHFTNAFYAYRITPTGINPPIITHIGAVHGGNYSYYNGCGTAIGQMKASSNGLKIGFVFSNVSPAVAEVLDFNPTTGVLSNAISLTTFQGAYGFEFSPDNSKVYITSLNGLDQYDISSGDYSITNASRVQISSAFCLPSPMQLGPDGKIYVSRCNSQLGIINNPNSSGASCFYTGNGMSISPATNNTSLPLFIAGYNYTNRPIAKCADKLDIDENAASFPMRIYPNPSTSQTTIHMGITLNNAKLTISNMYGQTLKQIKNISGKSIGLPCDDLPNGIYFIHMIENDKVIGMEKLIISK